MKHFGFVCPPYLGHLNPMLALASELGARGHRITFFGLADLADLFPGTAFGFHPIEAEAFPLGSLAVLKAHMAAPRGFGLFRIMNDMGRLTDVFCHALPAAIEARRIDALVVDQLEPAGGLVAEHLGLPIVSVANALPIDRDPAVPPPFTDWRYDASPWGLKRNSGGYRVADLMMSGIGRGIARWCRQWRLPERRRLDECLSPLQVAQTVRGFDLPRTHSPSMQPCGPFRSDVEAEDDAPIDAGSRFVFASLGTLQGSRYDLFRRIAQACYRCGIRLVIAHGGGLTDDQAQSLPGDPIVRRFVAQRSLLAKASLAVTNGGLNTVLDALAAGVPVVTVPIAFEQGAIGVRLEHCGAGLSVPLRRSSVSRLAAAIDRGFGDRALASGAARLAAEIKSAGGATAAASVIEAAMLYMGSRSDGEKPS